MLSLIHIRYVFPNALPNLMDDLFLCANLFFAIGIIFLQSSNHLFLLEKDFLAFFWRKNRKNLIEISYEQFRKRVFNNAYVKRKLRLASCWHSQACFKLFQYASCLMTPFCFSQEERALQNIRQLTFPEMNFEKAGEAYFSPDSESIIFQAVPKGEKNYQMFTMNLEEGKPKMVSLGKGRCTCGYFRPDGKKIIFASTHESPNLPSSSDVEKKAKYQWDFTPYMNIYEADPDGSNLKRLTSGPYYHAECSYSSDGKNILYASNETGSINLFIMDANGENVRQVTSTHHCYNGGPFFSPDNKQIVFRADRKESDFLQIYLIHLDGSNERQLTDNHAVNWAPYWHPNGKVIAFTSSLNGHNRYEIYLMNIETGLQYRLTNSPSFDGLPAFNKDGNKLMWTSNRKGGKCHVFIADFSLPIELK